MKKWHWIVLVIGLLCILENVIEVVIKSEPKPVFQTNEIMMVDHVYFTNLSEGCIIHPTTNHIAGTAFTMKDCWWTNYTLKIGGPLPDLKP